ncbi:MAG: sulfurtransferase [Pseudomonadota bacterium]
MLPLIVEPADLKPLLDDPNLLIVDLCREENYLHAHLPGALHVSPAEIISGKTPAVGKLPDRARLNALFSRLGYTPDRPVVAYDDEGGGWAGRFIWTLDVIGHRQSSYLNGGLVNWLAQDGPVTAEPGQAKPTRVSVTTDPALIASMQDVLDSINSPDTVIWDARSAEEYAGTRVVAQRGGHVPGAINLDWLLVMDHNDHLRIRSDAREMLAAKGITGDRSVITHCQTHHRSGLTYLVGKSLGFNIKAYDGSWSEWGNDPNVPVES